MKNRKQSFWKRKLSVKSSETSCSDKIGYKFNKFWLHKIGYRSGHNEIHQISIAKIIFRLFCLTILILCIYLVGTSMIHGYSNKIAIGNTGYSIHSGLLTGIFYFMVICLSLRYPFYWKWGLYMIGFDRQIKFHRICAYLGAFCCIFHILDHGDKLLTNKSMTGWGCYLFAILLLIFASSYFRRKYYNSIFIRCHWIFIIGFIIMGWLHNAILIQIGTFIVIIDKIIRYFDHKVKKCKVTNIQLLDYSRVIRVEFKKKYFSYKAGQFVFIRFPDLGYLEFHPFSLSSYPGSNGPCSLHIKSTRTGGWTDKLAVYASVKQLKEGPEWYKNINIQVEGPFGELTLSKPLWRYQHVIFIGGGIGVTPLDSLFNQLVTDLLHGNIKTKAKTKSIDFVFSTRSRALIREFASRNQAWNVSNNHNNNNYNNISDICLDLKQRHLSLDLNEININNINAMSKQDLIDRIMEEKIIDSEDLSSSNTQESSENGIYIDNLGSDLDSDDEREMRIRKSSQLNGARRQKRRKRPKMRKNTARSFDSNLDSISETCQSCPDDSNDVLSDLSDVDIDERELRSISRSKLKQSIENSASNSRERRNSLEITREDLAVGLSKCPSISFNNSLEINNIDECTDDGYDGYDEDEVSEGLRRSITKLPTMSVSELDIRNSTHITRVKSKKLRKEYKTAYSFIKFQRPDIRSIIDSAASRTKSKNIAILTSGPKSMINECKKWGKEFGVDVHFEIFDW